MPINNLNPGTSPNNGSGDPLRLAAQKINANFDHFNDLMIGIGSGEGGKSYDTLAQAQAVDPKPQDGTVFQVDQSTDPTNAGYHKFDSAEAGGTKFLRGFNYPFKEPEIKNIRSGEEIAGSNREEIYIPKTLLTIPNTVISSVGDSSVYSGFNTSEMISLPESSKSLKISLLFSIPPVK